MPYREAPDPKDDLIAKLQRRIRAWERKARVDAIAERGWNLVTPSLGYLTISNALQWRLQYGHAIREAGRVPGVVRL